MAKHTSQYDISRIEAHINQLWAIAANFADDDLEPCGCDDVWSAFGKAMKEYRTALIESAATDRN